jgi:hypothetical protein
MVMKKFLGIAVLGLMSSVGFAGYSGPVMTLDRASGFVPVEDSYISQCEVYEDHVVMRNAQGGEEMVTATRPLVLPRKVRELIAQASEGPFTEVLTPSDIPSTVARGYIALEGQNVKAVDIYTQYSGYTKENNNPAAATLLEMLNTYCVTPK